MKLKYISILSLALVLAGCQKESGSPEDDGPVEITLETSRKQIIITEQTSSSVMIFDQPTRKQLWSWSAAEDGTIPASRAKWFNLPDEAKPVDDCSSILLTSSGGGVALVRINDSKVLFYAYPAGNPHSAEMLPDGSVVVASSTGNCLTVYQLSQSSAYVENPSCTVTLDDAHSCVWDRKRQCLWAAGGQTLACWEYAGGILTEKKKYSVPSQGAHDLVPVYGQDRLILTTGTALYYFDPGTGSFSAVEGASRTGNVKSVSTGPEGFTTICTIPQESWYTDEVLSLFTGIRAFHLAGAQIYKARWRVDNEFSY